jgi:hypothetical protein
VTVAPGTPAPLSSVTVPTREPYRTWAAVGRANANTVTRAAIATSEGRRADESRNMKRERDLFMRYLLSSP